MAQGGQEKTEKATPRKLLQARRKGQVAKSSDLNAAVLMLAVVLLFYSIKQQQLSSMYKYFSWYLANFTQYRESQVSLMQLMVSFSIYYIKLMAPVLIVVVIVALLINFMQVGLVFSSESIKPQLKRANPIEGFKRIFTVRSLVELAKNIFKLLVIGGITYNLISGRFNELLLIFYATPAMIFQTVSGFILRILGWGGIVYFAMALLDYLYQRYEFQKSMRMSKQDIKDEYKQTEGDPLLKSKLREMQRKMSLSRIREEMPRATVVVTNPTHFAVALRYSEGDADVPLVTAKGADYLALRMREMAKEYNVPVIEQRELARLLYDRVEVGTEIPYELYQSVAEILAMVYKKKSLYL
ncbi:flagellar biosynthetic protein FlhB [Desulfofarcimen acetoxidans DSM 771]|jgi:flagellar biosynthetic protein FlhB|uniref:Flagellar biosynthetic protein FlhB n=1 Tax=Desulfofarcimen acetoxidans (strain ATCC 49208 / DSM 771 / KCTC 5769 / VKM B-1644 / 5575) TaxID=485916 RepID=C8W1H2_DESAS|nr:flagellar biosynthesis protein FlhB [Desulfofarcimen acetoxidans]ACV61617.1 flagellar biosynthetic protein FlhB [Desulfofarcimen acetoxidans DSM 771]